MNNEYYKILWEPIEINSVIIKNRISMSPMHISIPALLKAARAYMSTIFAAFLRQQCLLSVRTDGAPNSFCS